MGRDLLLCAKLREIIFSQFKDNISQCKIAKNLDLPPSTVINIGEGSVMLWHSFFLTALGTLHGIMNSSSGPFISSLLFPLVVLASAEWLSEMYICSHVCFTHLLKTLHISSVIDT